MPEPATAHSLPELEQLIACHECDLLMGKPSLVLGEKAESSQQMVCNRPVSTHS